MALKQEVRDYITKLAQTLGVDSAPMLAKAEADESAAKFVEESGMLRSDYSRKQDELTNLRSSIEAKQKELDGYYERQWLPNWNKREQDMTKLQTDLNALRAREGAYKNLYGDIDGFPTTPTPAAPGGAPVVATPAGNPQWVSREDAAALAGTLAKEMSRVGLTFYKEFNDVLDVDKFEEHVVKGGYQGKNALRQAYEDFVKPQRAEKAQKDEVQKIADAKKAGVDEWLAAHPNIPVDVGAPGMRGSHIFKPASKEDTSAAVLADANAPHFVKDQVLRNHFLKDLNGPITPAGILSGR
jgi:hypothetical protein